MASKVTAKCPCVVDVESNPYRVRELADDNCRFCSGEGNLTILVWHDPPPIPCHDADYQAMVEGWDEGPMGFGATAEKAVDALLDAVALRVP